MSACELCPRRCGVSRIDGERGICAEGAEMRISRIALHPYEEPPISGKNGSGTVFFCGCSLGCVFCQNKDISRGTDKGRIYTPKELANELLLLRDRGATNINLVTATHFADRVAQTLDLVKDKLDIPVVYNTSGYERVETLAFLDGLVDIYMPDFKYCSSELSARYSFAEDYADVATLAIREMYQQTGKYEFSDNGALKKGVLIRHLVLPGARKDSIAVLERIASTLPPEDILVSIMSQYTPDFAMDCEFSELHRRITKFEYDSVVKEACRLGFDGFTQSKTSAIKDYTPDFQ